MDSNKARNTNTINTTNTNMAPNVVNVWNNVTEFCHKRNEFGD